jgi:hypothetical protein
MKDSSLRIIVTGLIAQHPTLAGVTWDYLQYVLGLVGLGHDVYYLEDSGQWPYTTDGGPSGHDWTAYDPTPNVAYLSEVMARYGLEKRWAYHFPIKHRWFGLSHQKRREVSQSAALVINISGTLRRPQEYRQVGRLVYIDSDPVFTQVKLKLARGQMRFRKQLEAHDMHFSFGEHLSRHVPATGHRWRPTRQPIVLSEWRPSMPQGEVFTTIMNWTSYKPLIYRGQTYGQKDMEFKRFLELPAKARPAAFEVALSKVRNPRHISWERHGNALPPAVREQEPRKVQPTPPDVLAAMGWRVVDPRRVCPDLDRYRDYIESSRGEWSVAKHGYVVGQPGWFSCRSACYLAAGRPVVVQETGFCNVLPTGEGLLSFTTVEEAAAAVRQVNGDYARHAKAARAIAEEYFDSRKVLARLVDEAMNNAPSRSDTGGEAITATGAHRALANSPTAPREVLNGQKRTQ